jgi:outer membrane lipoprotein SlyB
MIRTLLVVSTLPLAIAACTPAEQRTALGVAGGAAIGAAVSSDDDREKGAVVGAIVGGVAAQLLGPAPQSGKCYYRDGNGQTFIADCQ